MTCYTEEMARDVSERAGRLGKTAYIHIKLDTGMSRLGFLISEESADAISRAAGLPGIEAEGMFTTSPRQMRRIKHLPGARWRNTCG